MSLISSIKEIDTELFLFLNSKHNEFFDFVMFWASHRFTWIPLYVIFFFLVLKHFGKRSWLVILSVVLLAVLSDQLSVHGFKNVFLRYRPCHNVLLQAKIHLNDGCGGTYGFVSSHAANTFALAMFLFLIFRNRIQRFGWLVFGWAAFVSYSRVYNGVHYPGDIATGAIVGMGLAVCVFKLYEYSSGKLKYDE